MVVAQGAQYMPHATYGGDPGFELGYDAGTANIPALPRRMPLAVGHSQTDPAAQFANANTFNPGQPTASHPRELMQDELAGILNNASPTVGLFAHLVLRGVSPQEAIALRGSDVNTDAGTLRIPGALGNEGMREMPLDEGLQQLIVASFKVTSDGNARGLLAGANASQASLSDLTTELIYAAHDAGVDQPAQVTPDALRHTCAAFLARQGVRLADLARAVGQLSADQAALYSAMAPAGKRLALEQVERFMPAVRHAKV